MKAKTIVIHPLVLEFLKAHALMSEEEVMGWLIGYTAYNEQRICSVIGVNNYIGRTIIHAEADPAEFARVSDAIPLGIGIVGMYHSHPRNVFHSSTDDNTLRNFASQYQDFISIVTNGEMLKIYAYNPIEERSEDVSEKAEIKRPSLANFKKTRLQIQIRSISKSPFKKADAVLKALESQLTTNKPKKIPKKIDLQVKTETSEDEKTSHETIVFPLYFHTNSDAFEDYLPLFKNRVYTYVVLSTKNNSSPQFKEINVLGVPLVFHSSSSYLTNRENWVNCWEIAGDKTTAKNWKNC